VKAAVNFTISSGVSPSPGFPPMVPLIPEIDLIRLIFSVKFETKVKFFLLWFKILDFGDLVPGSGYWIKVTES
jgi:hypothetical protein